MKLPLSLDGKVADPFYLIVSRHYKPNTAILEIGSISQIWFDAFRAQPPKQKHRRCDRAAIAEGEANPPYARPSPQADVSNDPYLGTPSPRPTW
jgi:hypothetical protein